MKQRFFYSGTAEHPVYVDVLAAEEKTGKLPIVMLHGGFHNGTGYLATPEGREGGCRFTFNLSLLHFHLAPSGWPRCLISKVMPYSPR